jgi:hypothetical protein
MRVEKSPKPSWPLELRPHVSSTVRRRASTVGASRIVSDDARDRGGSVSAAASGLGDRSSMLAGSISRASGLASPPVNVCSAGWIARERCSAQFAHPATEFAEPAVGSGGENILGEGVRDCSFAAGHCTFNIGVPCKCLSSSSGGSIHTQGGERRVKSPQTSMNRNAILTGIAMAFQFMSNFTRHHVWKCGMCV